MARLNNLSARLIVNKWLADTGRKPLDADLSYEEFATELRKITASTRVLVEFVSRADAVAYVRHIARRILSEQHELDLRPAARIVAEDAARHPSLRTIR